MVRLTRDLIKKKSEHHDGILADLEEISLHQLEIERIENNIIPKIENLQHCKDLEYLNLALNNIEKIEGLSACEFLNKLDLTVNFVDLDYFEESINHLKPLMHLHELFLMGNPCEDWEHCRSFVIASLPQLIEFDGKPISRGDRIAAVSMLPAITEELRVKALEIAHTKAVKREEVSVKGIPEDEYPHTPAGRVKMQKEMEETEKKREESRKDMEVPVRDYEKEHSEKVEEVRRMEEDGTKIHQCNQGGWKFDLKEDSDDGNIVLELHLPKFLDSSLIDVDVHPTYVTIIVKKNVFRIAFPDEVNPSAGTAKRSKTTGHLVLSLPRAKESDIIRSMQRSKWIEEDKKRKDIIQEEEEEKKRLSRTKPPSMAELMISQTRAEPKEAEPKIQMAIKATELGRIVAGRDNPHHNERRDLLKEVSKPDMSATSSSFGDSDDVPPLD